MTIEQILVFPSCFITLNVVQILAVEICYLDCSIGFSWQGSGIGSAGGVVSVRICEKLPTCLWSQCQSPPR